MLNMPKSASAVGYPDPHNHDNELAKWLHCERQNNLFTQVVIAKLLLLTQIIELGQKHYSETARKDKAYST